MRKIKGGGPQDGTCGTVMEAYPDGLMWVKTDGGQIWCVRQENWLRIH